MKPALTLEANFKMNVFEEHATASAQVQMQGEYVKEMTGVDTLELINVNNIEIPMDVLDAIAETSRQMMEEFNPSMARYLEQF